MDSQLTSMWVSFFTTAGIPPDVSATYALTFAENRIQTDMLLDLNKEYLRDMGIGRMGDVIAILRHAKQVHETAARDKVLGTAVTPKVPVAAVMGRATVTQTKPSSPASRILEHYTRNNTTTTETSPTSLKRKTDVLNESANNVKKSRQIRFGATVAGPVLVKEAPISKDTVFSRLGNSDQVPAVPSQPAPPKPVFSRLGAKSTNSESTKPKERPAIPIDKDALKYEGILKSPPPVKNMVTITTSKNSIRKISCTMRADEAPVSVKDKLSLPKSKSVKFSSHIEYKEIESVKPAQVKKSVAKFTPVFNKPERRLSMPEGAPGVKSRLGVNKNVNDLTITRNVFNRLGV